MTTALHVIVTTPEGTSAESNVPLKPFNYCGVNIAHVVVEAADAGETVISDAQYFSPCRAP
jgi:hypothetical protein